MVDGSPCDESIGSEERAGMTNQLRYQRRGGTIVGRDVEKTHDTTTTVSLTSLECNITDGKQFRPYAMIRVKCCYIYGLLHGGYPKTITATKR